MVGLVIVSHSAKLAEGVAELVAQMAGPDVRIGAAGGLDEPKGALGTDAAKVVRVVEEVWSPDGVLVLVDLGSAVLSAELAVDLLSEEKRAAVLLTEAPLVEGAVAAAVAAGVGDPLETVAAAARAGLTAKEEHLTPDPIEGVAEEHMTQVAREPGEPPTQTLTITVLNPLGLHARPAALLVRTAAGFNAQVQIAHATNGRGPVSARSLNGVATLDARQSDQLVLTATGTEAAEALEALRRLAVEGFGELDEAAGASTSGSGSAPGPRDEPGPPAPAAPQTPPLRPAAGAVLTGLPAAPGMASGPALLWRRTQRKPPEGSPTADPSAEWSALREALAAAAADIRRAQAGLAGRAAEAAATILDVHLLFLEDEALLDPARDAVFLRKEPAARAWAEAVASAADRWDAVVDPYQRVRAADLRAVGEQVLAILQAERSALDVEPHTNTTGAAALPGSSPGIVVTDDLSPADVAGLDPAMVTGVACAYGGPTSHAVILARALGLPAVVGAGAALLTIPAGTPLALDGDAGTVTVAPSPGTVRALMRRREAFARQAVTAREAAGAAAVTRDGAEVQVEANIAGPQDVPGVVAAGADGVGLLRTEFLFLGAAAMPDEDEQAAAYEAVAAALGGRPLTIRTLDAGADKRLPYLPLAPEANPFLGVRGLRLSLRHPEQLRCQFGAILRVAATRPLRLMLPMVTTPEEVGRARELLAEARASLEARDIALPARLDLGIMLEIPAAALIADHLAPLVDFFSVGTNDLTQYAMAAERGNSQVAALADPLHPAVLRLIERATAAAAAAGIPVAVCGEVAGERLAVPLLLGLGVRGLSMSHALIPAAKQAVRSVDLAAARVLAGEALAAGSAAEVRTLIAASPA